MHPVHFYGISVYRFPLSAKLTDIHFEIILHFLAFRRGIGDQTTLSRYDGLAGQQDTYRHQNCLQSHDNRCFTRFVIKCFFNNTKKLKKILNSLMK